MFGFGKKNNNKLVNEQQFSEATHLDYTEAPQNNLQQTFAWKDQAPDRTQDLMQLIGQAIDIWSQRWGLEKLPSKVIFEQALSAMNALSKTKPFK
jgi:hypothetical protein